MNFCCIHCFKNEFIQAKIRTVAELGKCSYCKMGGKKKDWVVGVSFVGNFVREKLKLGYRNASTDDVPYHALKGIASTIEDVLVHDEDIFSEDIDLMGKTQILIRDMFKSSGPSYREIAQGEDDEWDTGEAEVVKIDQFYVSEDENELLFGWEDFKYNVKHINRFFDVGSHKTREEMLQRFLPILKEMEVKLYVGTRIWRARVKPKGRVLKIHRHLECGPPPRNYAVPLRMNPSGISYFYGAEDIDTCNAEVRAKKRDRVIYGQFSTLQDLKIVDLSKKIHIGAYSIFDPKYDHAYNWASFFVDSFIEEVSRPINSDEASIEYVPTQILSEYIRMLGYDGVGYRSSLTGKMNYTLFCGQEETNVKKTWLGLAKWVHPDQVAEFTQWLDLVDFKIERMV